MRLEDIENKKEVLQPFFEWLFDDSRILNKSVILYNEVDYTLSFSYLDSNIYYPKQIKTFFETKAMHRLGRISQLDLAINTYPNLYHTRLEHSKGVYNRKLEEFFYKFQEPEWKNYIENNNLKLYLIAELIKMVGHDIGHLPLSHAFEEHVCHRRGIHEDIGKRLMLEDTEIKNLLSSISPELNDIMNELYTKDVLNFKEHDESSYDVDRLDFLVRDSLYLGSKIKLPTLNYESIYVDLDENNMPRLNADNSIYEATSGKTSIDVYSFKDLTKIEEALLLREDRYKNLYFSPAVQANESCISNFFDAFLSSKSDYGQKLRSYVIDLKTKKVEDLNLDKFIAFDEITLYSELIDIAEHDQNTDLQDLAASIIPNMPAFLTLIYTYLNMHDKKNSYSKNDKQFLLKIKSLIRNNGSLKEKLMDKNYISGNILYLPEDTPFLDYSEKSLINTYNKSISSYKKTEPIYIRADNGKIFELSNHPDKHYAWANRKMTIHSSYVYIPNLRFNGVSESTINKLKQFYSNSYKKKSFDKDVNMQPLQIGHNIEDYFLDL